MLEEKEIQGNKNIVIDLDSASKAFKKIKFLDGEIEKINEQAKKEKAEIDEWEKSEVKTLEGKRNYFSGMIEYYYREQKHANSKFRLTTPWGKVNVRKQQKYFYDDELATINYAKDNELQCIKQVETLEKDKFKKLCPNGVNPETGEFIPGIRVEEVETFSITTTKEK